MNNRIIKFRAWDGVEMHYARDGLFVFAHNPEGEIRWARIGGAFNGDIPVWVENKDTILMQFTGLLDYKGVEIYEGDIVKVTLPKEYHDDEPKVIEIKYDGRGLHNCPPEPGFIEVIGNIYENPDLLK